MLYLYVKAFHIFFVISWFAGIFYLPRLFVHHAMSEDAATQQRLAIMERKLYMFISPLGTLAVLLGAWLLILNPALLKTGWMHTKLLCVLILVVYHFVCGHFMRRFQTGMVERTHVFFRWFNEFPVIFLLIIVIMVVVRPF